MSKLENYGVEAELVEENIEFVKGFLAGAEVVRETVASSSSRSSASGSPKSATQPSLKGSPHSSPQSTYAPAPYSRGSSKSSSLESLDDYYSHERGASRGELDRHTLAHGSHIDEMKQTTTVTLLPRIPHPVSGALPCRSGHTLTTTATKRVRDLRQKLSHTYPAFFIALQLLSFR